jgi:peptidoglycan hydrolase-like protein with peptidoglycan-binding domain
MQLQRYLNAYEGARLTVDGIYGLPTQRAVMVWQEKNTQVLLAPFGLKKATGNVLTASLALLKKQEAARCAQPRNDKKATPGAAFVFTRTLKRGDTGEDVRQLQRYLNARGYRVASQGPGSPGKETTIFGTALENALKKFQQDHASTLLKPLNISKPTGVFGPTTKTFVNKGL